MNSMSGHSKWATTKRQKETADQKKGAAFTKLARAISVAAKKGGGDPETNFTLRLAISKAKQANMPKENIERTIERATGGGDGESLEELVYEAFGGEGTALIIEATTDNKNRLASEIKLALSRGGGKLADSGAALRLFKRVGKITVALDKNDGNRESLSLKLMDAFPDDISEEEGGLVGIFPIERLSEASKTLDMKEIKHTIEISYMPYSKISVSENAKDDLIKLVQALKNIDDVNGIYTNAS